MIKKHLLSFFIFLFFIPSISQAQNATIDSLELELEQATVDTLRLALLARLFNRTCYKNTTKATNFALEGLRLAEESTNYRYLAIFNMNYSAQLSRISTLDSAIIFIERAIEYSKKLSTSSYIAKALGDYGNLLRDKGDYRAATQKYLAALKIGKKTADSQIIIGAYIGLSALFSTQKMYSEAIEYNKKCAELCPRLPGHRRLYCKGIVSNNLATFYFKQKELDSALVYGLQSIEVKEQTKNIHGLSFSYNIVASIYMKKKDTITSLRYFNKAVDASRKIKNIHQLSNVLLTQCKIYVGTKNIAALRESFHELDSLMPKTQTPKNWINYYYFKAKWYQLQNDHKNALFFYKKKFNLVDSLRNTQNATLISTLETKYETNRHKIEKDLAEKEALLSEERASQSRRNTISIAIFAGIICLLLLYILSRLRIINQQKTALDAAYLQLDKSKQNEVALLSLKALQAQMNPHFIFNALNSIQDLVLEGDARNSTIYLGKFSDLIRKILLSSKEQFISLEEELEILRLYLDLEKLRFGKNLILSFHSSISIDRERDILLPAMFIQPYIENAIKHGLFHKEGLKKLSVDFSLSGNILRCVIEDNGIGQEKAQEMKEKMLHLHTGFSTEAINHRILFLNQTLNKKIEVETIDLVADGEAQGTRVTLLFEL